MRFKFLVSVISLLAAQVFFVIFAQAKTPPIPPTILKPEGAAITTAKPLIAGVSPNDTIVEILVDGELVGNAKTNNHPSGTGNFFFQIEQSLTSDTYIIEARAIDMSNRELISAVSKSVSVSIIPFGAPTLLLNKQTALTRAFTYIQGVAHSNSRIHVFIDDKNVETFKVGAHPSDAFGFKHTLASPIRNGEHTVYLKAEDDSGRFSLPSALKKIHIVDLPAPTILAPVPKERIITDTPFVAGIAFNDSKVKIFVNGKENGEVAVKNMPSGIGIFTYATHRPLPRGQSASFMAKAYDAKGRVSNESNRVDAFVAHYYIPPTLFAVSRESATPLVTGVAHNDSTIAIFVDGERDSTIKPKNHPSGTLYFETRIQKPFVPGAHRVSAQAFDAMKKPSQMSNIIIVRYAPSAAPETATVTPTPPSPEEPTTADETAKESSQDQPAPPKEELKEGQVTAPDESAAKTTDREKKEEIEQKTPTNWPLFIGVLLLIVLAIIFIVWYLGTKRQLLNDGIDRLFSEEDETPPPPASQTGPSLFSEGLELPKTIGKNNTDIPPPPPSI